jgi:hypothetical protein
MNGERANRLKKQDELGTKLMRKMWQKGGGGGGGYGPGVSGWRSSAGAWLPALQAGQVALQRLKQAARRLIFTTSITLKLA